MNVRKTILSSGLWVAAVVAVLTAGVFLSGCRERRHGIHTRYRAPAIRSGRHDTRSPVTGRHGGSRSGHHGSSRRGGRRR